MLKKVKIYRILLCVFIFMLILTATRCPDRYELYFAEYAGRHPDLYTISIKSILHVNGAMGTREHNLNRIRDGDEFGRVLFSYHENFSLQSEDGRIWLTPHLILQKTDGEYVYFYEHINFVFIYTRPVTTDEFYSNLTALRNLKHTNNWGQELSCTSEFVRIPITRINDRRGPVCSDRLIKAGQSIFPDIFRVYTYGQFDEMRTDERWVRAMRYFRSDPYGRSVYSLEVSIEIYTLTVFLFQSDHIIDASVIILSDRYNHQIELRDFLEANGWNTRP